MIYGITRSGRQSAMVITAWSCRRSCILASEYSEVSIEPLLTFVVFRIRLHSSKQKTDIQQMAYILLVQLLTSLPEDFRLKEDVAQDLMNAGAFL